jgi:transcriptional regulator with GAF, ATPase, and Fis domain
MENMIRAGLQSTMAFPLIVRDTVLGSLHFSFRKKPDDWEELQNFLEDLSTQVAIAVDNMLAYIRLQNINESLQHERKFLKRQAHRAFDPEKFFFASDAMFDVMQHIKMVASTDASVLITGETGTGKEYVAHCIHALSQRRDALLVKVNCPALASGLFESELFGHTKGAFTGASQQRMGRFEMANRGTIFLDEIGELPMHQQAKILHVLQDQVFERVGDSRSLSVDCRVVAATNKDLGHAITNGDFRSDLFYRLNTAQISIPPLRERPEDIPVLVNRLSEQTSEEFYKPMPHYPEQVMDRLMQYSWPGNVRELKNFVHRMILQRAGDTVRHADVEGFLGNGLDIANDFGFPSMEQIERQHLERALRLCRGKIGGQDGAAMLLDMPRTTLQYRLKRFKLKPKDFR